MRERYESVEAKRGYGDYFSVYFWNIATGFWLIKFASDWCSKDKEIPDSLLFGW